MNVSLSKNVKEVHNGQNKTMTYDVMVVEIRLNGGCPE